MQENVLRIKWYFLTLLTACLGTALAMNAKEQDDLTSGVVSAVTKEVQKPGESGSSVQRFSETHFDLSAIKRPIPKEVRTSGLFESKSWYVMPQAPVVPVPSYVPPQVTTPTLPFIFIGRMVDGNEVTLFLSKSDRQYTVKEKDILDDTYRVEKISDSDAVLTYLPTDTQQKLLFNVTTVGSSADTSQLHAVQRPIIPLQ